MQLGKGFDGFRVDVTFIFWMLIDPLAHSLIAEILGQHPPFGRALCKNMRRAHAIRLEPVRHLEKGLRVFVRWRSMHKHCGPAAHAQTKITAEAGIADKRGNLCPFPLGVAKEVMDAFRQSVTHGQRLCQDAPDVTTASRPSPTFSSVIERHPASCANPPAWSGHSAINTAPSR